MVPATPAFHYQLADRVKCICSHSFSLKTPSKLFNHGGWAKCVVDT